MTPLSRLAGGVSGGADPFGTPTRGGDAPIENTGTSPVGGTGEIFSLSLVSSVPVVGHSESSETEDTEETESQRTVPLSR